jgi:2-iminobutanoate/2-iminopropanoate deaminase
MPISAVNAKKLPKPRFMYSQCLKAGPLYQAAGMLGVNPETGQLEPGGPGAETTRILANMQLALPDWGVRLEDLLIARIFTTRLDLFADINKAWEAVFTKVTTPPARTSIGVAALPFNGTVEIEFCFYRES